ncbi:XdhC family protein [Clostridium sp. UBA2485]|uniref:XdhC family protein n=1 Tax=Clostridium sp. UBA2485 TaxID=1946352 RepID=UPI0039C866BD
MRNILGFHTTIFEDREEYGNYKVFTDVDEIILGDIEEGLNNYNVTEECYIVIVTRGHIHDEIALRSVINNKAKYVGMI